MPPRCGSDKGAFGTDLPERDLYLSPGHPVLVGGDADLKDGVLVPVMCLVNGLSVARMTARVVTYWHVELDAHDILLAEGLPVAVDGWVIEAERRRLDEVFAMQQAALCGWPSAEVAAFVL